MTSIAQSDDFDRLLPRYWNGDLPEYKVFGARNRRCLLRQVGTIMQSYAMDLAPDLDEDIASYVWLALSEPGSFDPSRGGLRGYIKSQILSAIHRVRAENPRVGHRTRLVNDRTRTADGRVAFRPTILNLDARLRNSHAEALSIGDTVASPIDVIADTRDNIAAEQIFEEITEAGYADLGTALRIMYDDGSTLNAAANLVKTHQTTLRRQRGAIMQRYEALVA